MKYEIYEKDRNNLLTDCIIIFTNNIKLSRFNYNFLPLIIQDYVKNIHKSSNFTGKYQETLFSYCPNNNNIKSVLFLGLGDIKKLNLKKINEGIKNLIIFLNKQSFENITINVDNLIDNIKYNKIFSDEKNIYHEIVKSIEYEIYNFMDYKSKKCLRKYNICKFYIEKNKINETEKEIKNAEKISVGINFARDLGNQPANICTPEYLSVKAMDLKKKYKDIELEVLEKSDMEKLGMGALLAVSLGSPNAPKLIIMKYKPKNTNTNTKPIIFVGKGITFDTGGNSLKPANSMIGMKYDMCGGAAVFGIIKIIAELKLPLYFIGVIASAENIPGGYAVKPDDIVKTHSGITVEVLNTDAEGRLVLCDALSYIKKYNPKIVIDIATLTGACIVALGREYSGLFSNNKELTKDLLEAGEYTNDKCWQLPISNSYTKQLKSNFADIANIGNHEAGSITAACFLYEFIKEYKWAHLDVAGTACCFNGNNKQSTGRPIPLLLKYLQNQCNI